MARQIGSFTSNREHFDDKLAGRPHFFGDPSDVNILDDRIEEMIDPHICSTALRRHFIDVSFVEFVRASETGASVVSCISIAPQSMSSLLFSPSINCCMRVRHAMLWICNANWPGSVPLDSEDRESTAERGLAGRIPRCCAPVSHTYYWTYTTDIAGRTTKPI